MLQKTIYLIRATYIDIGLKICFAEPSDKMSDDFEFGSNISSLTKGPLLPMLDLLLQISAVH